MSPSVRNINAWILQALLAAMFIFSGGHKLMDLPGTMKMFGGLGLPGWFAGLIGGAGVLGLMVIMIGAVFMHATKIPGGLAKGVPAIVALVLVVLALRSRTEVRAVWTSRLLGSCHSNEGKSG